MNIDQLQDTIVKELVDTHFNKFMEQSKDEFKDCSPSIQDKNRHTVLSVYFGIKETLYASRFEKLKAMNKQQLIDEIINLDNTIAIFESYIYKMNDKLFFQESVEFDVLDAFSGMFSDTDMRMLSVIEEKVSEL